MQDSSELVVNLWAIFDSDTLSIYAVAGKVYTLPGGNNEKLSVLRSLSVFDHQTIKPVALPETFSLITPQGEKKNRMANVQEFHERSTELFEKLLIQLENMLPKIVDFSKVQPQYINQRFPSNPLCIKTLVCEDAEGNRRSIITDEDRVWLDNMISTETNNNSETDNQDNATKAAIKAFLNKSIDMDKAISAQNIYAGAPEQCDLCNGSFIDDGLFIDGALREQVGWACMCVSCFGQYGKNLGWGVGQLYQKQRNLRWLQVAGFN